MTSRITPVKAHHYTHHRRNDRHKKDVIKVISDGNSNFMVETSDYKFTVLGQKKDSFEHSKNVEESNSSAVSEEEKKESPKGIELDKNLTKKIIKGGISVVMAILSGLGIYHSTTKMMDGKITYAIVDFDPESQTVDDMASIYNVDRDVLLKCNGFEDEEDLKNKHELKIPTVYKYMDDAIIQTTKNLYSAKGDSEVEEKEGARLDKLVQKEEEQEDISYTYTDGDYVYIKIKDFKENPEFAEKYGSYSLSCDYINELFDIKFGELQKYNSLQDKELVYSEEDDNTPNYRKSDIAMIETGGVIKVSQNAINTSDINLSKYDSSKDTE